MKIANTTVRSLIQLFCVYCCYHIFQYKSLLLAAVNVTNYCSGKSNQIFWRESDGTIYLH